jgi:hypothetical protein
MKVFLNGKRVQATFSGPIVIFHEEITRPPRVLVYLNGQLETPDSYRLSTSNLIFSDHLLELDDSVMIETAYMKE